MSDGPILEGIRVLDFSSGIAGPVAALLLAEAGADVVKIESATGSSDRALAGFRTWNRSKRSVVADATTPDGRATFQRLLKCADVLIHNENQTDSATLGIDDQTLRRTNPRLIVSSVTAWPVNHAKANRPMDELLACAELGLCDEQMPIDRDGPVYVRAPIGSWISSYLAAIAIATRLVHRDRSGTGGSAHTSLVQGMLVPMGMHWSRAEHPSDGLRAGMAKEGRGSQITMFECGDGEWIHVMPPGPDRTPLMQACLAEIGADRIAEANRGLGPAATMMLRAFPNLGGNQIAFKMHPRQQWLTELWANDVPAQPCAKFGEILLDEQARANGYAVEIDDLDEGRIVVAGLPLTTDPSCRIASPAPAVGAHTNQVIAEWTATPRPTGLTTGPTTPSDRSGAGTVASRSTDDSELGALPPLDGLRVLDLGNFLAGPYATQALADLGAEVIKLEMTTGDPMRPGDWAFVGCQRGKRSLALDLKSDIAKPILERAVRWADVVHHNLRLPAAKKLGVDPESVRAINTGAIICHTSSYGPTGPRADWPGYDQMFQASCGWEVFGAGEGNMPMWLRFGFMDHICALSSVLATLLAYRRKLTTGVATEVRASLLGAAVMTNSETFVRADGTFAACPVLDKAQLSVSLGRRIAQTANGWIAIAADAAQQVATLLLVLDASDEASLITSIQRQTTEQVLGLLSAAKVPCGPLNLQQKAGFFDDADNRSAGLVASYPHPEWGTMEQPGALWNFGDLPLRHELAPPTLGQHTVEILQELGLDAHEIDSLLVAGAAVQHG